jgi:hypothetical protein
VISTEAPQAQFAGRAVPPQAQFAWMKNRGK